MMQAQRQRWCSCGVIIRHVLLLLAIIVSWSILFLPAMKQFGVVLIFGDGWASWFAMFWDGWWPDTFCDVVARLNIYIVLFLNRSENGAKLLFWIPSPLLVFLKNLFWRIFFVIMKSWFPSPLWYTYICTHISNTYILIVNSIFLLIHINRWLVPPTRWFQKILFQTIFRRRRRRFKSGIISLLT